MIDRITHETLKELRNHPADTALSLYLPTIVAGPETQQNKIRLKNLLQQAEKELAQLDLRRPEIEALLAPGQALLDDALFWSHQASGLALFLARDFNRCFRSPTTPPELLVCADRFHLKPLFPLLTSDGRFLILVIAKGGLRLFEATRDHIEELQDERLPKNLADALKFDDPEAQLQFHTGAPSHGGGARDAMFHGQGSGADDEKSSLLRYFQRVDQALGEILRDETAPLVLAGVEYLHPIYRSANSYPHLHERGVLGNMEAVAAQDLHAQAWPLVAEDFEAERTRSHADYERLAKTEPERASDDLENVLAAASNGRVQALFVAGDCQRWGRFQWDSKAGKPQTTERKGERQPGDSDLLDEAACQTFVNGGSVYVLPADQLPGHASGRDSSSAIRAVYRY